MTTSREFAEWARKNRACGGSLRLIGSLPPSASVEDVLKAVPIEKWHWLAWVIDHIQSDDPRRAEAYEKLEGFFVATLNSAFNAVYDTLGAEDRDNHYTSTEYNARLQELMAALEVKSAQTWSDFKQEYWNLMSEIVEKAASGENGR